MNLVSTSPALWPFLAALLLLVGSVAAVVMRKVSRGKGIALALLSLVLVLASLVFVRGQVVVSTNWSVAELRRPALDARDVPYSDAQLEEARLGSYKNLALFGNLVPFWLEDKKLNSMRTWMSISNLHVAPTATGVTLTMPVPLLLTFLEEKPLLLREGFMQDLVHPECQRNLAINELRRLGTATPTGESAKVEHLVAGRCSSWARAESSPGPFVVH